MTKPLLVIALGGNALLKRKEPLEANIQYRNVQQAAQMIATLATQWRIIVVHGNGPQVGLLALQNSAYEAVSPYPLDVLVAETQGMIGYMLQQALNNLLPQHPITTLLTQVEVNRQDPAFLNPTKYIGPLYPVDRGREVGEQMGWTMKLDGQHMRRVVPSPQPLRIIENDAIMTLLKEDHLIICNGGGGIPVERDAAGMLMGVQAVIDKDLSAALLARQIKADALLILTDADAVYRDWGTAAQQALTQVTPNDLQEMTFDAGSMGPKITAACDFVTHCHGIAGIGSLEDASNILSGGKGTRICPNLNHPLI
nr:carbamate kinase [Pantoea sp. 201603H]